MTKLFRCELAYSSIKGKSAFKEDSEIIKATASISRDQIAFNKNLSSSSHRSHGGKVTQSLSRITFTNRAMEV